MNNERPPPMSLQHELKSLTADRQDDDWSSMVFEDILDAIGSRGWYQRRFNLVIAFCSTMLVSMAIMTFILAVIVPDHWCLVPGRENTTLTLDQWKNLTLPRDGDSYSRCEMFETPGDPSQVVPCEHGWEFDDTWFSLTIPSHQGWVCQNQINMANAISLARGLSVVVGLILPYIGDRYGRRLQFMLSFTAIALGRTLIAVSPSVYPVFVMLILIAECGSNSGLESGLAVSLELTDIANRSAITLYWMCFYSAGCIAGALLAWPIRNYVHFMTILSAPCFLPLLCYRIFPESPRWLVSRGRPEAAVAVVQKIAKTNGVQMPSDVPAKIAKLCQRRSLNFGVTSLVTNRNLFKNTALLIYGKSVCQLIYWVLVLNVGNLSTNPFLLLALSSVVHLPGYLLAHRLGDGIGRRAANCIAMATMAVLNCGIVGVLSGGNLRLLEVSGMVLMKMTSAVSLSLCHLQSLEIHPTCIRQTAEAVESAFVWVLLAIAPYIVFLGQTSDSRYLYGILAVVTSLGAVILSFLPESMHEKLPETLEDASTYGKDQRYWSLPPPRSKSTKRPPVRKTTTLQD